jgi:flavocytochrome c
VGVNKDGTIHMTQNGNTPKWDEETDIVVIGSGLAGLAAAIEAKIAGCSVIVLEKMKGYGGNSTISDGVMAAAGTVMQADRGIEDSPQLMYADMVKAGLGLNQPELVRTVTEKSNETFQWTVEYLGVQYLDRVDQFGGHSVARCYTPHNRSGSAFIRKMLIKLKELGVTVRTTVFLQNILKDPAKRVRGVRVREGYRYPDENSGVARTISARKAVILTTGGFANDIDFRTSQDPRLDREIMSTNKYSTTGEALRETIRIGAMPVHLSWIQLGPWACPDEKGYGIGPDFASYIAFPYGIVIDPATGKRIMNELADRKMRADAILQKGHPCIALTDKKGVECSGYQIEHCLKKGIVKAFRQIDALAGEYNIPVREFKDTIKTFNSGVENGIDDTFGKPILPDARPLMHPPYYAMRVWPKVHHTMGGVLINANAQVLDLLKKPIEGFYAAGEVTGGVHGASRLGSCAITDCLVFGRIAGRNAAAN